MRVATPVLDAALGQAAGWRDRALIAEEQLREERRPVTEAEAIRSFAAMFNRN